MQITRQREIYLVRTLALCAFALFWLMLAWLAGMI